MKKNGLLKNIGVVALTGVLSLGAIGYAGIDTSSDAFKVGDKFVSSNLNLGDKAYVLDYKYSDVTGDKINDDVILVGTNTLSEQYCDTLNVVVKDGNTKQYSKATYDNFSGYKTENMMSIGDFDGDKVNDVMVDAPTGGSGGIVNHMIATFKDNKPNVIFGEKENNGLAIDAKFVDNYKAQIVFKDLNKTINLDLSANKDYYNELGMYDANGKLIQDVAPWIDPISQMDAIDYDGDGVYELNAKQDISGACHADRITHIDQVLKFENGKWTVKNANYTTPLI